VISSLIHGGRPAAPGQAGQAHRLLGVVGPRWCW